MGNEALLRRLVDGDVDVAAELRAAAVTSTSAPLLVAAALVAGDGDELLARAMATATASGDRQVVAIAAAQLDGDHDLADLLARDHLADRRATSWPPGSPPTTPRTASHNHHGALMIDMPLRPPVLRERDAVRVVLRWTVTFVGFPLGSIAARWIAGPVDDTVAAAVGGLVNGAVLGAAQWWGLGRRRLAAGHWIAATAVGLMLGLAVGASAVGFATDAGALIVQGAICGVAVAAAQAIVLRRPLGAIAAAWPLLLAALWAAGWAITSSVGVRVDEQFTVFGSSGAVVVTAVTAVLPLSLRRRERGA